MEILYEIYYPVIKYMCELVEKREKVYEEVCALYNVWCTIMQYVCDSGGVEEYKVFFGGTFWYKYFGKGFL